VPPPWPDRVPTPAAAARPLPYQLADSAGARARSGANSITHDPAVQFNGGFASAMRRKTSILLSARAGKNNFLGNNVSRVAIEARCAAQKLNGRTGLMSLGSLDVLTFCPP
jgi:hypothetical protein